MFNSNWEDRRYHSGSVRSDFRVPSLRDDARPRLPGPVFWLAAGVALLVVAAIRLGPDINAADGQGARGYFVAQAERCDRHGCEWSGQFRLDDGQVTRSGVGFSGNESGMLAGTVVPALDTANRSVVFSPRGDTWLADLVAAVVAIPLIAMTIRRLIRRRRNAIGLAGELNWRHSAAAGNKPPGR